MLWTNARMSSLLGLLVCLAAAVDGAKGVKVGMMNVSPNIVTPISYNYLYPAAQIAQEKALAKGVQLELVGADDNCCTRPVRSAGALAAGLYDDGDGVDAFLGPPLSTDTVPVADMAAYWNLPVLSGASTSTVFSAEERFPTLVRTSPSISLLTDTLLAAAKRGGYTDIVILRGFADATMYYSKVVPNAAYKGLEEGGLTVVEVFVSNYPSVAEAVTKAASLSKFVFVSKSPVVDVMTTAQKLGFSSKTHTFMYWYPHDFPSWQTEQQFETLDDNTAAALDALTVLRIAIPTNPEYQAFQDELRKRHQLLFGEKEIGESYFAAATHDVLLIYAQVIGEIIKSDGDVRDGNAVVQKMKNRSFQGVMGTVDINDRGDRYGVCEMLKIKDKKMTVVSTFDQATQTIA